MIIILLPSLVNDDSKRFSKCCWYAHILYHISRFVYMNINMPTLHMSLLFIQCEVYYQYSGAIIGYVLYLWAPWIEVLPTKIFKSCMYDTILSLRYVSLFSYFVENWRYYAYEDLESMYSSIPRLQQFKELCSFFIPFDFSESNMSVELSRKPAPRWVFNPH